MKNKGNNAKISLYMKIVRFVVKKVATLPACVAVLCLALCCGGSAQGTEKVIHGSVPKITSSLTPIGALSPTNQLRLAIGLPLRNQAALSDFLAEVYDPGSPEYRHYLTPAEFTARFGPTVQDYQSVMNFAAKNGLAIVGTSSNRLVLDVKATVANIQKAFNVKMLVFQHPIEPRTFYAPDVEPSVDASVPILGIEGLNNYALPHPFSHRQPAGPLIATSYSGSGPGGTYGGYDYRDAYIPGVTLTGSEQDLGLVEFDGYQTSDINSYESEFGLPDVPLSKELIDGADGNEHGGEGEVCLDIENAISMAPGLNEIIVYEAPSSVYLSSGWYDLLNQMVNDDLANQLSSSWGAWSPADPVAEQIFQEMQAQGQSFFQASGDDDAYNVNNPYEQLVDYYSGQYQMPFPVDSTNLTSVGGTTLTTSGPLGSWVSETVWNWGIEYPQYYDGTGSGGGVSSQNFIPPWQMGVGMWLNQGSTTMRNIPDVALTADNVDVFVDGSDNSYGGTSCAAPLWAALTALVNQQAAANGFPPVGFLNPSLYAVGMEPTYNFCFHDITTENNEWSGSPDNYVAIPGYDLCTGWGTPTNYLIDALQPRYNTFGSTESMNDERAFHTATLMNNGEVLVAGGEDVIGEAPLSSSEIYNPGNGTWTSVPYSMSQARYGHTATLLTNGYVLVTGGYTGSGVTQGTEFYIPGTGVGENYWRGDDAMNVARAYHTATVLTNGTTILVAGGVNDSDGYISSSELYSWAGGAWTYTTSPMNYGRFSHTATLLPNGDVLVTGGLGAAGVLSSAEVYDEIHQAWGSISTMTTPRYEHTATLLPNGQVLVAGGINDSGGLSSAELYNPATGLWTATRSMHVERWNHTATLLPNGNVLVEGGDSTGTTAEVYDWRTAQWTVIGSMSVGRFYGSTATVIPDGQVLVAGGGIGHTITSNAQLEK